MPRLTAAFVLMLLPAVALAQGAAKPPAAKPSVWVQDYELARSQSRARQVPLLLLFMGPATDGAEARFEQQVLGKPEFVKEAAKQFVLARFDYPKDPSAVPEVWRQQNASLLAKYPAAQLPVVWLTDGIGKPFAKITCLSGGPKEFLAVLERKQKAWQQAEVELQRAAGLQGRERAEALAAAFRCLDDCIVANVHYKQLLEVIGADADGKAGLKAEFEPIARDAAAAPMLVQLQEQFEALLAQQQWSEVDALLEKLRAQHQGERWAEQYLTMVQGRRKLDGDHDAAAAAELFTTAIGLAARSELAPHIEVQRQRALAAAKAAPAAAPAKQGTPVRK